MAGLCTRLKQLQKHLAAC
jgi:hypothetical protein